MIFLRGEQVAGASEAGQVARAHDLAPIRFAERQDPAWGVGRGGGEDRDVHLDLRAFGGVVDGAVADFGGKLAEQAGAGQVLR
jgi:hypothetical protein